MSPWRILMDVLYSGNTSETHSGSCSIGVLLRKCRIAPELLKEEGDKQTSVDNIVWCSDENKQCPF